jgi:hypothetical protein
VLAHTHTASNTKTRPDSKVSSDAAASPDFPAVTGKLLVAIALLCGTTAATRPPVTIVSPCECHDNHGKGRWQ